MGRKLPQHPVDVDCPLAGFEGVQVTIDTGLPLAVLDEFMLSDGEENAERVVLGVKGWDFVDDDGEPIDPLDKATCPAIFRGWLIARAPRQAVVQGVYPNR